MTGELALALPRLFRGRLEHRLPLGCRAVWYGSDDAPEAVVDAQVLWLSLWDPDLIEAVLESGAALRWVSTHSAGVEFVPLARLAQRGIMLTNGAALHADPIAEFTVLAILAAAKRFPARVRAHDRGDWGGDQDEIRELAGTRALLVGFGGIGRAVSDRLGPFGVETVGVRRGGSDGRHVLSPDAWRAQLGEFDWVVLSAPLTRETRGMFGAAELESMKRTGWLVNVGRGALVDQEALVRALVERRIGGAVLDVTDPEPPAPDDPIWAAPNLLLTGHTSGNSPRTAERAADLFLDNLDRFRAGRPLKNVVDLHAGY